MKTIGIDIGGRTHVVARCRDGQARADREIVRVSQDRAGFAALDRWLERQPEPMTLVTMECHEEGLASDSLGVVGATSTRRPRSCCTPD